MAQMVWFSSGARAAGAAIVVAFAASACVPVPKWVPPVRQAPVTPEQAAAAEAMRVAVRSVEREASQQVRRCYRSPRIASVGRQIVTTLRARYTPDGTLIGLPELLSQSGVTPTNRVYAGRMAEAASLAVIRCVPVKLSDDRGRGGITIVDFTFSPSARG